MPSTVIDHFVYHSHSKTLTITFLSGNRYEYLNVPEHLYLSMRKAQSKGQFFNQYIKEKYSFKKLEEENL
jgi:hypothetical protein